MKKHCIGSSGIEIASLGMGCWSFGGGAYWGSQSQADVNEVVREALEKGVNYFDTAEAYNDGESERSLGIALRGLRSRAVIGSKVSTSHVRPDTLIRHCEESLRRLGTDYLDLYMLHWPVNPRAIAHFSADPDVQKDVPPLAEVFGAMRRLKEQGKVREIGLSNHGVKQMREALDTGVEIAVNELPYNLISRGIEAEILPFCREHHIGVLGYMAYQQGVLTGSYEDLSQIPPSQAHSRHFNCARGGNQSRHGEEGAEKEINALLCELRRLAAENNCTVAELSLAFAMACPGVCCTLAGSRNLRELRENLAFSNVRLSDKILLQLKEYSKPVWDRLGDSPDYYENRANSRIW